MSNKTEHGVTFINNILENSKTDHFKCNNSAVPKIDIHKSITS